MIGKATILERAGDAMLRSSDPSVVLDGRGLCDLAADIRHGLIVYRDDAPTHKAYRDLQFEADDLAEQVDELRRKMEQLEEESLVTVQ